MEPMAKQPEAVNLKELMEFSPERRVRKKFVQTDIIVSELVCYEPGQGTKQHIHPYQDEIFYAIEGEGYITFAEQEDIPIAAGSVVFVPAGVRHGVETAPGSRLTLMFTKGPGLPNPHRKRKAEQEA